MSLNCRRYSDLPLAHNGGPCNPLKKTTFPPHRNFKLIFTRYIHTLIITIIPGKKIKEINKITVSNTFSKWRLKTNFCYSKIVTQPKFEKPVSQRNFSKKNSLELQNMNTFTFLKSIKKKKIFCLKMAAKTRFEIVQYCYFILISSKTTRQISFFFLVTKKKKKKKNA